MSSLDPHLWEALEAHGLTPAHMDMLLQALQVQQNGSLAWHFARGSLTQCDLRLVFTSRRAEVTGVCEAVMGRWQEP